MKKKSIILLLIFIFSCTSNNENTESNSDCANPEAELIFWLVIDDTTENPIPNANGSLVFGSGTGNFIHIDSSNDGICSFCWKSDWNVVDGYINAENYEQMDLTGIIPSEINTIRLIPSN